MSFETKCIAFFGVKSRCFLLRSRSPVKAVPYADETLLSFQDSTIRATQYQHWLYKHSDSPGFVSTKCCEKATWLNSCFNKNNFCARLLYKCDVAHNFFNIYQNRFFDCNSFPLLRYQWFTFPFWCKRFSNPNTSKAIEVRRLKYFKDRESQWPRKNCSKMQKFWRRSFATQGRITLELSIFRLVFQAFYLFQIILWNCALSKGRGD